MKAKSYLNLIKKSPIGYALQEIICDQAGAPVDYMFIEVNEAFERFAGFDRKDVLGKRITELIPGVVNSSFDWIKTYGEVALKGESIEFVQYVSTHNRWYRVNAHSPEHGYCVIFFNDVSNEMRELEVKNIILTSIHDIIFELNEELIFENVIVSDDAILFIPREHIIGSKLEDIFSGELVQNLISAFHKSADTGKKEYITYKSPLEGVEQWFTAEISYRNNVLGKRKYIVSVKEITKQKLMELELEQKKEELERFFHINLDLLCIADLEGNFVKVNISWEKILGYSVEELEKRKFLDFVHPEDLEATIQSINKLVNNEPILYFVNRYKCKDGTYRYIEWCSQPYGKLIYAAARDITEHKLTEEKILYLSFHDQLTGIYNRRYYIEELNRVDVQSNLPLSLIMADVNGLKYANDVFGHLVGDEILIATAKELEAAFHSKGVVSRIGGDEFVIILPRTDRKTAEELINQVKQLLLSKKVGSIRLSVSFGVATKTHSTENLEDIFKKSEEQMYQRKAIESPIARERIIKEIALGE